jgi:hypothetical protein
MNVKNALHDKCTSSISFLKRMIADLEQVNANLHNIPESYMFNREAQRQHNLRTIETYKDEIIELEDLRDGRRHDHNPTRMARCLSAGTDCSAVA